MKYLVVLLLLLSLCSCSKKRYIYVTGPAVHDTLTVIDTVVVHRPCHR